MSEGCVVTCCLWRPQRKVSQILVGQVTKLTFVALACPKAFLLYHLMLLESWSRRSLLSTWRSPMRGLGRLLFMWFFHILVCQPVGGWGRQVTGQAAGCKSEAYQQKLVGSPRGLPHPRQHTFRPVSIPAGPIPIHTQTHMYRSTKQILFLSFVTPIFLEIRDRFRTIGTYEKPVNFICTDHTHWYMLQERTENARNHMYRSPYVPMEKSMFLRCSQPKT